jgi:hypothetical protein
VLGLQRPRAVLNAGKKPASGIASKPGRPGVPWHKGHTGGWGNAQQTQSPRIARDGRLSWDADREGEASLQGRISAGLSTISPQYEMGHRSMRNRPLLSNDYTSMCFGIGGRRENLLHPASSQTRNVGAYLCTRRENEDRSFPLVEPGPPPYNRERQRQSEIAGAVSTARQFWRAVIHARLLANRDRPAVRRCDPDVAVSRRGLS